MLYMINIIFWRFITSPENLFLLFMPSNWYLLAPSFSQTRTTSQTISQIHPTPPTKSPNQTTNPPHTFRFGGWWKRVWKTGHESQSLLWSGWWLRRCQSALGLAIILARWHGAGLSGGFAAWGGGNCAVRFFFCVFFWIIQWWDPFWGNQT